MRRFMTTICLMLIAGTVFSAYPNWHFKDSTFPYWRVTASGQWKFQTGVETDGLLWYRFLDDSNPTTDSSGNGYDGTVTAGTWIAATNGIAARYDFASGTDIDSGQDLGFGINSDFTVSVWLEADSWGLRHNYVEQRNLSGDLDGWNLRQDSTNKISGLFRKDGSGRIRVFTTDAVTIDAWQHVVMVKRAGTAASTVEIYLNGVSNSLTIDKDNLTDDFAASGRNTYIGGGGTATAVDGRVWNPKIYDTALDSTEILATNIYQAAELGILSQYLADNLDAWSNCVFNLTANNVLQDGSQNHSDITTASSPTLVNVKVDPANGAADFNGSANNILVSDDDYLSFSGGYSISAWVSRDNANDFNPVVSKLATTNFEYQVLLRDTANGNDAIFVVYGASDGTSFLRAASSVGILADGWHHVVGVYEGDDVNCKIYIDGVDRTVLTTNGAFSTPITPGIADLEIGSDTDNARYMDGKLDEVKVFDNTLTSNEVYSLYKATTNLFL